MSVMASRSGQFTCMACSNGNCELAATAFFVTSLAEGFQVEGPSEAVEGDTVEAQCSASKYNFSAHSLGWFKLVGARRVALTRLRKKSLSSRLEVVESNPSNFDVGSRLRFESLAPADSGVYVCRVTASDGAVKERKLNLTVHQMEYPVFVETFNMDDTMYVKTDEAVEMRCVARGVPRPTVSWYLNDTAIDFSKDLNFILTDSGQALRLPTVVAGKTEGRYTCKATNRAGVASLEQNIVKVESPKIYETNMVGSAQIIDTDFQQKIAEQGSSLNLTCRAQGNPAPHITWRFNGQQLRPRHGVMVERRQTLVVSPLGQEDEGRYECVASNIGGSVSRYQLVKLKPIPRPSSVFTPQIAIPIYIAIGVALVIAVLTLVAIKYCCSRTIKSPATPPTPRLTQYEQPEETESCRLTSQGSSHSQETMRSCQGCSPPSYPECSACQYNGLYCSHPGPAPLQESPHHHQGIPANIPGSSLVGLRACYSPSGSHYPGYAPSIPSPLSDFTNYSQHSQYSQYSQATLPLPMRMETLNREISKRLQERQSQVSPSPPLLPLAPPIPSEV